ncbi:efflux RND transporter periplasmic adaptor subunit [Desulfosporosinus sp. Sb-LF]|uniref:efflux RND transporter periplasmic adaptor subunit n=1 Tax=Desulfosporosinus sp. Sb-LF TaxID=2560027 RepID=UPI00107FD4B6|nr:efflux RND transporter periplasmic adaptor subunit [Desulfosporosinus sp. Sb-LF]TGE31775.1 HlyD family efflux transporter periplasmic adaptor subunit [Desulfosporosinus sp. Sb-LF]
MNRKSIKWISGGLLVTVLFAGGLWFYDTKNANASTISYITGMVRNGTVEKAVSATGTIQPINQYNLSSSSGGKITEIDVKIGDQVKSGQILAKLDPTQAQQQVTQAQNGLTQAQLKLNQLNAPPSQVSVLNAQSAVLKAQSNESNALNNLRTLQSYKNTSILKAAISKLQTSSNQGSTLQDYVSNPSDLDAAIDQATITYQIAQADLNVAKAQQTQTKAGTSNTDIQLAQSQVTQAQTSLNSAQTTLNSAVITAPADGTITAINGQVGASPSGSQGSSSSTSNQSSSAFISMIGASDTMQVVVPVNQVDIGKISAGLSADITLDAFSNKKFQGTVVQVSPTGTTQSGVTTFNVTVNVTNTDNAMKSGMSANVSIIIAQKKNVVTVPSIAVHSKGSTQTVSLAPVGQATPVVRTVQIGLDDGKNAEVIQGLQEGDKVVIGTKTPQAKTTTTNNSLNSALSGGNMGGFGGGNGGGRGNYSGAAGGSSGRTQN